MVLYINEGLEILLCIVSSRNLLIQNELIWNTFQLNSNKTDLSSISVHMGWSPTPPLLPWVLRACSAVIQNRKTSYKISMHSYLTLAYASGLPKYIMPEWTTHCNKTIKIVFTAKRWTNKYYQESVYFSNLSINRLRLIFDR